MKLYISTSVTITNSALRRRAVVLPLTLLLAFSIFFRLSFLLLQSLAFCPSSIECMRWRFVGGTHGPLMGEEVAKALVAAMDNEGEDALNTIPASFQELVKDITSNTQDIKAFAFNTKNMLLKMEHLVKSSRQRESVYWHIASHGLPKSFHCLSLRLAEEFAMNAVARSSLPPPEFITRLSDPSLHHVVLLTDNILAASVVISSATKSSTYPEKLVFHIVTDKKTYTPMHAWFSSNSIYSTVVQVKGLHQYDWSHDVNIRINEMLEIHRLIQRHNFETIKVKDLEHEVEYEKDLEVLWPNSISLLNHLRIYLPELFPALNKILFLDDDIIVQHDLSSLWNLDLNGKVVGAVVDSWCGHSCCPGRKYDNYFNFTDPTISSSFESHRCGWLYGINVFDLQVWRVTNITAVYHQWLRHNLNSGFVLWQSGSLPPALIAFQGHLHELDPYWHLAGLGYRTTQVESYMIRSAAVVHFSGPAKPWLEIGASELRGLWYRHINLSNESVRKCGITG
ncbi:hypothetical protein Leryth_006017 [Lithospermum erythrorhizon]|nr:hypothetical protein Leryth_006017 [Lithospermum erythrorhizon]